MVAAALKRKIDETDGQITQLSERMEEARGDIVAATATFAAGWWEDEARRALLLDRDRTDSLDDEQLHRLKADVRSLVKDAEAVAEAGLAKPDLWPHLGAYEARPWHDPRFETEGFAGIGRGLEPAVGRILRRVLPVLLRHGFRFPDRKGWPITDRYPQHVEYPETFAAAARSYYELAGELRSASRRMRELRRQKGSADIEALWKKA
jgi:hypothetical protein